MQGPAKARRMAGSVLTESLQRAGGAVSPERDLAPHEERGKGMQENRSPGISRRAFVTAGAVAGVASIGMLAGCSQQKEEEEPVTDPEPQAAAPETPSATPGEKVYLVDTFRPKPGDGKAFLEDYLKTYGPMAEAAGLTLESSTVAPPMWLDKDSNVVQVVWSMPDIAQAAWAMSSATRYDPAYVEWCSSVRKRVVSRDRSYFASEDYLEVLCNV